MSTLLSVSVALLAGLLMTRAFKPLKLPSVTAYLIAGILIGPYCVGRLGIDGLGFSSADAVGALGLISEVALGFIAFSIGSEFRLDDLKKTGKQASVIGVFQALTATLLVDLALYAVHIAMPDKLTVPQLITLGEAKDRWEARQIVARSTDIESYEPKDGETWGAMYEKFKEIITKGAEK